MLDLVCKRYPGRRPSDYLPHLSDYDAFRLDAGIAFKSAQIEREDSLEQFSFLSSHLLQIRANQHEKRPKSKTNFKRKYNKFSDIEDDEELPELQDITKLLGGK